MYCSSVIRLYRSDIETLQAVTLQATTEIWRSDWDNKFLSQLEHRNEIDMFSRAVDLAFSPLQRSWKTLQAAESKARERGDTNLVIVTGNVIYIQNFTLCLKQLLKSIFYVSSAAELTKIKNWERKYTSPILLVKIRNNYDRFVLIFINFFQIIPTRSKKR